MHEFIFFVHVSGTRMGHFLRPVSNIITTFAGVLFHMFFTCGTNII
jgi:hypothetical protein